MDIFWSDAQAPSGMVILRVPDWIQGPAGGLRSVNRRELHANPVDKGNKTGVARTGFHSFKLNFRANCTSFVRPDTGGQRLHPRRAGLTMPI
jgi:hypothetical protein